MQIFSDLRKSELNKTTDIDNYTLHWRTPYWMHPVETATSVRAFLLNKKQAIRLVCSNSCARTRRVF
jgi:hypothetical protein